MSEKPTCETCRYFERRLFATGPCLRHAPVRSTDAQRSEHEACGGTSAAWPWVRTDNWCGDYEPKEPTK